MLKLRSLALLACSFSLASPGLAQLTVGSFNSARARGLSSAGTLGYDTLRASLTDTNLFGSGGTVDCPITLAPEVSTLTATYLASIDVFFSGDGFGSLSTQELTDLAAFHSAGGHIILINESSTSDLDSIFAAIGSTTTTGPTGCPNGATDGLLSSTMTAANAGPFGTITAGTYSTTLSTQYIPDAMTVTEVLCPNAEVQWISIQAGTVNGATSGAVYASGDPSLFDLFTNSSQGFYNPNNLTFGLNIFADLCGASATIGTNYCGPATPNSTGASGVMSASGSSVASDNNLLVRASNLPNAQFAYMIASRTQGFVANPGGSQGNLCILGGIARFNRAGEIGAVAGGQFSLQLPMGDFPEPPTGSVVVMAGDTWNFQCWHRDIVGGTPTSNFTDGLEVFFQ